MIVRRKLLLEEEKYIMISKVVGVNICPKILNQPF